MVEPLSFNTMVHMITIKLSATNFLLWKSQLIPLLQCQGCIGFIDGSLQQPNETITTTDGTSTVNPEFLEWKLKDQRILSLFCHLSQKKPWQLLLALQPLGMSGLLLNVCSTIDLKLGRFA
jgi:hypothetical protein